MTLAAQIISVVTALGVGSIIGVVIKHLLDRNAELKIKLKTINEEKYKSLLVFMACAMDINKRRYFSLHEQVPNETSEDYMNQLKEYYYHSILYSSDKVILCLKEFIDKPCKENYINTAKEMRKELWEKDTNLKFSELLLLEK